MMNEVVQMIQALSDKPDNLKKLQKHLEGNLKNLKKNVSQIDNVLNNKWIFARQHTLGYIYLLHAKLSGIEVKDHNEVFEQALPLLIEADPEQVSYAPAFFANVCRAFSTALRYSNSVPFIRGVYPLSLALQKLQGASPNVLTPVHAQFAIVCLKARCYSAALPVLDTPLYEIRPKDNGLDAQDYLLYFYYGGVLYLGLKKFAKAIEFFQLALTIPTRVLSAIQVECYKKYVLACLILNGEMTALPVKLTSQPVLRSIDRLAAPYMELSRAMKKGGEQFQKVINDAVEHFKKDRNWGLVKQARESLIRRNIQRLTNTYITLSLSDIARSAPLQSPKEAEKYVMSMIEDGAIFATINQRDGMVSFLDNPEDYDSSVQVAQLDQKIQEVMALSEKLKGVDKLIQTNPKYIVKTTPGIIPALTPGGGGGILSQGGIGGLLPLGMGMGMMMSAREQEELQVKMAMDASREDMQQ